MKRFLRLAASDGPAGPTRGVRADERRRQRPSEPAFADEPGARMYERTLRTSVCRGTVIGSVPPHSTTVRSPNGNAAPRGRTESRGHEPAVLPRDLLLAHHAADRAPRPAARADALDRVGDDELVERPFDLLGREPRSKVARHVVEAKRRQHGGLCLDCSCRSRTQACSPLVSR